MDPLSRFDLKSATSFYTAPTSKSGIFTTTSPGQEQDESKKSCIMHLPGKKKVDLTDKMDCVVVFQAIEIERLSQEVENLRVKLKDADRQIQNYHLYEVQIQELTENSHQLEEKIKNYQSELQKMSLACNALYEENNQGKNAHQRELEILRRQFGDQVGRLQDENNDMKRKWQQLQGVLGEKNREGQQNQRKTKLLSQQLVRMNQNMLNQQNKLNNLRNENEQKAANLQKCLDDIQRLKDAMNQEKRKQEMTEQNLNVLNSQNDALRNEIGNLQRERLKLQQDLGSIGEQIGNKEKEIDGTKNQIEQFKTKLAKESQELNNAKNQIQEQRRLNDHIKHDIDNILGEVQRLKQELFNKDNQNEQLMGNNESLFTQLKTTKIQFDKLVDYANVLNDRINDGLDQIEKCKETMKKYDDLIQQADIREKQLQEQIGMLEPLLQENGNLKEEIFRLNEAITDKDQELGDKESHITDLTIENKELTTQGETLKNNMAMLDSSLREMEQTLGKQRRDFMSEKNKMGQHFEEVMERQQQEKEGLKNELTLLKEEGLIHQSTKTDLKNLRQICEYQAEEMTKMQTRIDHLPQIITKLKDMNKENIQAERTNQNLREQLIHSVGLNEKLIDQVGEQMKEIFSLQEQVWAVEQKLRDVIFKNDDMFQPKASVTTSYLTSPHTTSPSRPSSYSYNSIQTKIQTNPLPKADTLLRNTLDIKTTIKNDSSLNYKSTYQPKTDQTYAYKRKEDNYLNRDYGIGGKDIGHSNQRYSPYKNLPVSSQATSDNNLESRNKVSNTTLTNEVKGAKGIKAQLVGGLPSISKDKGIADYGREEVYQSTIFGEGPIFESKRVLESSPHLIDPKIKTLESKSYSTSSFQKYKRDFKP